MTHGRQETVRDRAPPPTRPTQPVPPPAVPSPNAPASLRVGSAKAASPPVASPTASAHPATPRAGRGRLVEQVDLAIGVVLMAAAAAVAVALPVGNPVRAAVALPVLLVVPGYLLVQCAMRPPRPLRSRGLDAFVGLGVSPPLVGVLAFATSFVEGGFRAGPIVAVVLLASMACAAVAGWRRTLPAAASPAPTAA